jgi:hypothetical protein
MDTMEADHLVDDYLRRLEHAAAHMQRARRTELVAEIRGHIETALAQEQATGEAAVRNLLDRLGPPEEIVEAAEPPPGDRRAGRLEIVALLALILPVIGWMIGTILVFASRVWSRRDKLIGALLLLLPILVLSLPFVAASAGGRECGAAWRDRARRREGRRSEFGIWTRGALPPRRWSPQRVIPGMAAASGGPSHQSQGILKCGSLAHRGRPRLRRKGAIMPVGLA